MYQIQTVFLGPKEQSLIKNNYCELHVWRCLFFLTKFFSYSLRSPVWKDGSTAVTALVMDDVLYVANLGDSKVHVTTSLFVT